MNDLQDSGINLAGLHAIRRELVEGERRLVGRIASLAGDQVILEESFENLASIPATGM